jgi:hypothetical protein
MSWSIVPLASVASQPWRNGGGGEAIEAPPAHLAWCLQEGSLNGAVHGPDALWAEVLR